MLQQIGHHDHPFGSVEGDKAGRIADQRLQRLHDRRVLGVRGGDHAFEEPVQRLQEAVLIAAFDETHVLVQLADIGTGMRLAQRHLGARLAGIVRHHAQRKLGASFGPVNLAPDIFAQFHRLRRRQRVGHIDQNRHHGARPGGGAQRIGVDGHLFLGATLHQKQPRHHRDGGGRAQHQPQRGAAPGRTLARTATAAAAAAGIACHHAAPPRPARAGFGPSISTSSVTLNCWRAVSN